MLCLIITNLHCLVLLVCYVILDYDNFEYTNTNAVYLVSTTMLSHH